MKMCCIFLNSVFLKQKQSAREYIPGFRSGPYALIIALRNAKEVSKIIINTIHGNLLTYIYFPSKNCTDYFK